MDGKCEKHDYVNRQANIYIHALSPCLLTNNNIAKGACNKATNGFFVPTHLVMSNWLIKFWQLSELQPQLSTDQEHITR